MGGGGPRLGVGCVQRSTEGLKTEERQKSVTAVTKTEFVGEHDINGTNTLLKVTNRVNLIILNRVTERFWQLVDGREMFLIIG